MSQTTMIAMLEEAEDVLRRAGCDMTADRVRGELQAQQAEEVGDGESIDFPIAFLTTESGCGKYKLVLSFASLPDLHKGHDRILSAIKHCQPPAQHPAECGSCDGFDSGCEECSGLGKDGHLAALRQLANVAHRVAHAMGLPAGFDVMTLPDVVVQRLAAQQQAVAAPLPPFDVFSNDDGDSWETHPASDNFVHGLQLGEEFELLAGWQAERVTFRVTKVPDDESDDYEVEEVTAPAAAQEGGTV